MTNVPATPLPGTASVPVPRRVVRAWTIWDFGQQSFNTVILTFVYGVYLTTAVASDPDEGAAAIASWQAWAGFAVALLAPALGVLADRSGKTRSLLIGTSVMTIVATVSLWFIKPDDSYLALGAILLAVGTVMSELAFTFYNGLLLRITTPENYGRVSGTAWGLGYVGGVIVLVLALVGFVLDDGLLGLPTDGAVNIRAVALMCAAWTLVFGLPLLVLAPRDRAPFAGTRVRLLGAYAELGRRIIEMWKRDRVRLHFFVSTAVYRDGIATIFAMTGTISAAGFGMDLTEVMLFGLAANLVAAATTWLSGKLDDRIGPRPVITGSLAAILVILVVMVTVPAEGMFWVGGLGIAAFMGPILTSTRSMLARMSSVERAQEDFGLYATAGRALGFIGQAAFAWFVILTGETGYGMIGVAVVLLVGLALFVSMRFTERWQELQSADAPPAP